MFHNILKFIIIIDSIIIVHYNKKFYKYDNYYEITSRIYSLINALVSVIFSLLYYKKIIDIELFSYCWLINIIFLVLDSHLYITNRIGTKNKYTMLFHHIIFFYVWLKSKIVMIHYCRALLTETSTIFLNLSWFSLKSLINNNHFKIYSVLFSVSFFIVRIVNLTHFLFETYNHEEPKLFLTTIPITILNYYWMILITKKMYLMFNNPQL